MITIKKPCALVVAAIATSIPAAMAQSTAASDSVTVTLADCLRIALSTSPTVKVADLDITRVDYSRKETLAQLLPSVNFGGTYSRMVAKQVAYMNMDAFAGFGGGNSEGDDNEQSGTSRASSGKGDGGIKMGLDNSFQVGFNAGVPLIAPQLWQSLKLADTQIATAVEQSRASRLNLVNSIKSAYYAYLLALDSRRVIRESYDMAAFTHDLYVKRQSLGDASEYDVLRTAVAMKNVEPELTQADIAINRARMQLMILMGVSVDTPLKFSGKLADYEASMYDDVMKLGRDFSNNTSLRLNQLQTQTLERALKVQKMAWYPTLSLSANYNWTSSSNGNPLRNFRWNPYSVVGLTLNLPLYEGGARVSRIRQAQIQVDQARLQREDLERSVAMQVDLALENITLNMKQIASSAENVGQAERAHDIMQRSFNIGAASYLDLRDSELSLTQSRLAYYQTIYNYLVAGSELELLLGNAVGDDVVPDPRNK